MAAARAAVSSFLVEINSCCSETTSSLIGGGVERLIVVLLRLGVGVLHLGV